MKSKRAKIGTWASRCVGAFLVGVGTLVIAGCGAFDEVHVEMSSQVSVYGTDVGPCVSLVGLATLRDDIGSFSTLTIRPQTMEQKILGSGQIQYTMTGETEVRAATTDVYDWTCESTLDPDSASVEARVLEFRERLR